MLYLLRLLIACLALVSGGRVAEAAAERGAAGVTIEAPRTPRERDRLRVRHVQSSQHLAPRAAAHFAAGHTSPRHRFERSREPPARALFLLHGALLR